MTDALNGPKKLATTNCIYIYTHTHIYIVLNNKKKGERNTKDLKRNKNLQQWAEETKGQ